METYCNHCWNKLTPTQQKESIKSELKFFFNEGVRESAEMIPYNDAFFEIVQGKYKGSLVHIWNIIKG